MMGLKNFISNRWFLAGLAMLSMAGCRVVDEPTKAPQNSGSFSTGIIQGEMVLREARAPGWKKTLSQATLALAEPDEVSHCGAVLISNRLALTAAHCLFDSESETWQPLEDLELRICQEELDGQRTCDSTRVMRSAYHPSFTYIQEGVDKKNSRNLTGDLAILLLERPLKGSTHIRIRSVAPAANQMVLVAGYGVSENDQEEFDDELRMTFLRVSNFWEYLWMGSEISGDKFMVVHEKQSGACFGDSGGPAYRFDENQNLTVVGITSHLVGWKLGSKKPCESTGAAFTRIDRYSSWIMGVSKQLIDYDNQMQRKRRELRR